MRSEIVRAASTWILMFWVVRSYSLVRRYNIWEDPAASIFKTENFYSEDGDSRFLRNSVGHRQTTRSCKTQGQIPKENATRIQATKTRFSIGTELNYGEESAD
jgi:hypothetical protein